MNIYQRAVSWGRGVVSPPKRTEVIPLGRASGPGVHPPRARLTEWTSGDASNVISAAETGQYQLLGQATTEVLLHPVIRSALDMLIGLLGEGRWVTDPPELAQDLAVMLAGDHRHPPQSLELEDVQESATKTSQGVRWAPSGAGRLGVARSAVGGLGIWRPAEFVRRSRRWVPVLDSWSIEHFRLDPSQGWKQRTAPRPGQGYWQERPTTVDEYTPHVDPQTGAISEYPDWLACSLWGPDRPWCWGWWAGLIWPAMVSGPDLWKQLGRMLESRAMSGLLVGQTSASDEKALQEFANRLYEAGEFGVFAINKDREAVDAVDTGANQGAQVFDSSVLTVLRWIEITLLGGSRLWSDTGSRASSEVQRELIRSGVVVNLGNAIASWIQSSPGALWGKWNGYSRVSCRWVVPWEQADALESVGPVLDRLIVLAEKQILSPQDVRPLIEQTLEQAGISIETQDDVAQLPDTVAVPREVIAQVALGRQLASVARLPARTPGRAMGLRLSMGTVDMRTVGLLLGWHDVNPASPAIPGWGNRQAPAPEWVEWLLHGGDAGQKWAERVISSGVQQLPATGSIPALPAEAPVSASAPALLPPGPGAPSPAA